MRDVVFDGHDLTELFAVEYHVTRSVPSWRPSLVDVAGRSGSLFAGTRAESVEIGMDLYAMQPTREGRQLAMRTLAAWLAVDSPRWLSLSDEGGLWRLAAPMETDEIKPYLNADMVHIKFVCPDPRLFGETHAVTVPANGSKTVLVGGTAPTSPTIACDSATPGSTGFWRVSLGDGTHLDAAMPTGVTSGPVFADCEKRVLRVNDMVALLQPAADWLVLSPGENTIAVSGSGDAVVTWTDRWW